MCPPPLIRDHHISQFALAGIQFYICSPDIIIRTPFHSHKCSGLNDKLYGHPLDNHFIFCFVYSLSFLQSKRTCGPTIILSAGGLRCLELSSPVGLSQRAKCNCLQMAPPHLHLNIGSPLLPHPVPSPLLPPKWTLCLPHLLLPLFSFMLPPTLGTTY